jgi:CheY-like chemotaxis protein
VRLPRSPKREESAEPLATSTVARALARRKVLVVDDNLDGAQAMASLLELIGHDVHVAHDGMEAIAAAERLRPDLVLMDVGLPKLNGLEATRQIRKEPWGRAVRIFALTGFGQDADREASRSAGCDGHLVKPVAMPDLERTLAQVGPGSLSRAPASTRG